MTHIPFFCNTSNLNYVFHIVVFLVDDDDDDDDNTTQ
jgi:hypothetical protein